MDCEFDLLFGVSCYTDFVGEREQVSFSTDPADLFVSLEGRVCRRLLLQKT